MGLGFFECVMSRTPSSTGGVDVAGAGAVIAETWRPWGVGDVGGGGSGTVEVEGVGWMLTRRWALCYVNVCQVMKKNGGKVVG